MEFSPKDILRIEVAPALGCTEPVAIALGAAAAKSLVPQDQVDSIEIWVDPNIYKNGLAVLIPGTPGLHGLDLAAALGALGGDAALGLEVLDTIDDDTVRHARELLKEGKVKVNLLNEQRGLLIKTLLMAGGHAAVSLVETVHDNIAALSLDGEPVEHSPLLKPAGKGEAVDRSALEAWLKSLTLKDLLAMVDELDQDDLDFIKQSVVLNSRLADYGLKHGPGLGIGKALQRLIRQKMLKEDMMLTARMYTSAAADARMAGVKLPAMASAGSGNHGLTAVLPIWAIKDYVECDEKMVLQAIGFSHLITSYVKAHTGRLTALCGCSIAAGAGATAGVALLLGGNLDNIAGAIKNLAEDLAGVICDGAKSGCALKLATAAGSSVQAALFALQGVNVLPSDGIVGVTPEQTTRHIGTLSTEGMLEADRTILQIMLDKQMHEA
jgi:L-cysteine desulfidase